MDRIVLEYDGSTAAESALEWVAYRARFEPMAVDVHVVRKRSLFEHAPADAEEVLERARRRLRDLAPWADITGTVRSSRSGTALLERPPSSELTVIGMTRRPTAATGAFPPRSGPRGPACFVPAGWTALDTPVTVGVDDDESSDDALEFAAAEAAATGVALRIVHAWLLGYPAAGHAWSDTAHDDAKRHHHRILERAAVRASELQSRVPVETLLVRDNPTAALSYQAPSSSLLVLGRHPASAILGPLFGSVALDLLGHVATPLCVVPPREESR
ncbi:nucleotide-binding universal stress UspA family protein [Microbacterium sp. SORGH_AS 505]|uniref:universal stress protein n=1 Tax=Microbacterium sp. SORGH_AS_0505 TaxID=3041770 RepID=UPI00277F1E80|nr:universal stress protein [Microbacterium sp. SORGH_AS_0505]MDQ1125678.1 nucleotide-binding universal stress UspA family protein [Microbacterium sp. SORGH_AS_0505]